MISFQHLRQYCPSSWNIWVSCPHLWYCSSWWIIGSICLHDCLNQHQRLLACLPVVLLFLVFTLSTSSLQAMLKSVAYCVEVVLCSNSRTSLRSQVPRMFMSCKPILSNSFIKCWLMKFVFSSNRPVCACSFRPFISIPIISICLRNFVNSALDLSSLNIIQSSIHRYYYIMIQHYEWMIKTYSPIRKLLYSRL